MRRAARRTAPRRTQRPPVALTGTPGVGKSTVARRLPPPLRAVEVAELALATGTGRRAGRGVVVDLPRLRRALGRSPAWARADVVVGHLAHLLPVRAAIVLRCHPRALARRLRRARRGAPLQRAENVASEALDLVLAEAVGAGLRVYEIDTTGVRPAEVAREVARRVRTRGRSRFGLVDWLADRSVTEHLLDGAA
ncbi:MAG TPA: AAA family ATPase [Thermoplasmata archaeon]|nr:AAA family ATPase [Thermoplasmata archaeon]